MDYQEFLNTKNIKYESVGIDISLSSINPILFDWQKLITKWALNKGRSAIFLDTGLGKTLIQVEWARLLNCRVLIVAPLSVAKQTVRLSKDKLDIDIHYIRNGNDLVSQINITNYELLDHFNPKDFDGVVLDESSILKSLGSKTKVKLIDMFSNTKYRLCCTATPAPNDYIELGNHAEFLGVCTEAEMKSMFFINANKEHTYIIGNKAYYRKGSNKGGTEWRIKHPAENAFFKWLSSWSFSLTKPSDLGFDNDGFDLPTLNINTRFASSKYVPDGQLLFTGLHGIADRVAVRKNTIKERINILKEILDNDNQWIIWCGLDDESKEVTSFLGNNCIEVKGSDSVEYKVEAFEKFQDGKIRILVTKPKIGGFGMNFQNSHNMIFMGLNDSWETWYQCIRRQWRYGQTQPVNIYAILSDKEQEIYLNIMRKDAMAIRLREKLIVQIKKFEETEIGRGNMVEQVQKSTTVSNNNFTAMLGDSCERLKELKDNSIDLSVYSPPFADLYTYTDSIRDLGNSRDWTEFFNHYQYIIRELYRITKTGRLTCVHSSDIPAMKQKDGYIGIKDFPGELIREYEKENWIFTGRAFVQKNPQAQAIRTKSKALLFIQIRKDSSDSRPALVDQILIFKKPGENNVPINPVNNGELDNETWIEWANGIWLGISEGDTLQFGKARDKTDEKHICPLQLGTIERCIKLYSNPGETVLSPFMGIGSEGYQSILLGRKFIGCELKESYFNVAIKNLEKANAQLRMEF